MVALKPQVSFASFPAGRIGVCKLNQFSRGHPPCFGASVLGVVRANSVFSTGRFMAQRLYPKAYRAEDAMSSIARVYAGNYYYIFIHIYCHFPRGLETSGTKTAIILYALLNLNLRNLLGWQGFSLDSVHLPPPLYPLLLVFALFYSMT